MASINLFKNSLVVVLNRFLCNPLVFQRFYFTLPVQLFQRIILFNYFL